MKVHTRNTRPQYVCSNEKIKLIGGTDGYFPDFGHHLENEMGGLWLYPIKLLEGFWMHFKDETNKLSDGYMIADGFNNYPHKNEFEYGGGLGHTTIRAKRTQLAPEGIKGVLVRYEFENYGEMPIDCSTRFLARTDLRPCWLSEEVKLYKGSGDSAEYLPEEKCFLAKDSANPWYAVIACAPAGENPQIGQFFGPENNKGQGISCAVEHHFTLQPKEKKNLTFYLAGSENSREEALSQLEQLRADRDYEAEKEEKYRSIMEKSRLHIADKRFSEIFDWVKVHTNWLILDQDACGRGLMAGIPEYPWWFGCDSCYSLQGILAIGDFQLCRDTIKLLCDYSQRLNGNGRIVHEILPNGYCPNPGNTQETAHFITIVWKYYEYTGDWALVEECLPYIRKSIEWLKEQDDDNDLFPSGYGITEIAGLNMEMIDTAVYTCEAYECYGRMLQKLGEEEEAGKAFSLYEQTRDAINKELWDDRAGLYCDAYASYDIIMQKKKVVEKFIEEGENEEVKQYIKTLLEERKEDGNQERGWLLNRNWVIATPMEIGIAPEKQAERALARMREEDFIGQYGMYLSSLNPRAMMTVNTGVMAVAQSMYGHVDEALRLLEKMFASFSMATPGSISEMSPDYGCFVQAWTVYGLMAVVRFFFGIDPKASEEKIVLAPCMPQKWNKAELRDVRVLDGSISVSYEESDGKVTVSVENSSSCPVCVQSAPGYRLEEIAEGALIREKSFTVSYSRS